MLFKNRNNKTIKSHLCRIKILLES